MKTEFSNCFYMVWGRGVLETLKMNYVIVECSHIVPVYKLMSWIIRNIIGNFRNDFQLWKPDVVNNCQVINCWLRHCKNFPKIWSKNIHFIYCMHPNLTILNNLQNVLVRVKCVCRFCVRWRTYCQLNLALFFLSFFFFPSTYSAETECVRYGKARTPFAFTNISKSISRSKIFHEFKT